MILIKKLDYKFKHFDSKPDRNHNFLRKWLDSTKHFIKDHPHILFINADKGNITVTLDINEYINKMEQLLLDGEHLQ